MSKNTKKAGGLNKKFSTRSNKSSKSPVTKYDRLNSPYPNNSSGTGKALDDVVDQLQQEYSADPKLAGPAD